MKVIDPSFRLGSVVAVIAFMGGAIAAPAPRAATGTKLETPTQVVDASRAFLSVERSTLWNPGMMGVGGIPPRSMVCSTLTPSGGMQDDAKRIQAAINACPEGQV